MNNVKNEVDNFNKNYNQYQIDFEDYVRKFIIPDIVAYQIAQAYFKKCLSNISLKRHYTCMSDVINISANLEDIKYIIIEILHFKYNLTIVKEDPLIIENWR